MIYLTGDVHLPYDVSKLRYFKEQNNLTRNDYVIVLGDFGLLWKKDSDTYKQWLKWFNQRKYTLLWLDGNHENHELLNSYPVEMWNGGKVHKISDNVIHLMRGQVFSIQENTFFTMGGAWSIDKSYRIDRISWWQEEEPNHSEMEEGFKNLESHNNEVDYVLTHTCPFSIITEMFQPTVVYNSVTESYLDEIKDKIKYKKWYFGHWHKDVSYDNYVCLYNKIVKLGDGV